MNNRQKLIVPALCAALLLSGCNTDKPATTAPENETTTTAAETTTTAAANTTTAAATTTTTKVDALSGEEDTNVTKTETAPTDIMQYTLNQLWGKRIDCENKKSLHMNSVNEWKLAPGEAPKFEQGKRYLEFECGSGSARFSPQARFSSGAMSKECDAAFKEIVEDSSLGGSPGFGGYYDDTYKELNTVMDIDKVDEKGTIIMSKIKYGYGTQCYDKMFTVNAFVRRAEEYHIPNWVPEPEAYEIIIDPAYMSALRLPMLEYDPTKLKFNVNGTEFYADTMRGYVSPVSYLNGGSGVTKFQNDEFIYAKIVLMTPEFTYDNIDGALISGNLMYIEPLTEDTDSVINGTFVSETPDAAPDLADAMMAAKDEMIDDRTLRLDLIDLDFDGVPEVLTQYYNNIYELDGPYAAIHCRVFRFDGGKMKKLGEFERVDYEPFEEAVYIPTGEHGWHFTDYKDHCLLTIKNGQMTVNHISERRGVGEPNENGYYNEFEYYYLGEKITVEEYEDFNPLIGKNDTYYKWTSKNSLGYSVMADDPYKVYDMLYEKLGDDFASIRRYNLRTPGQHWDEKTEETGRFAHCFEPSENFPNDLINIFYTDSETAKYEAYYGISFEGAKEKPVIYLYPEEETDVSVQVSFPFGGELTCTYPEYNDGWNVTAMPDGTLYDENGDEYYCLYWEGRSADIMDESKGFCVAGADTAAFLREKLMYIGLTAREANEFIIYWLPKMQDNPYNIITLHTGDYAASVPLAVSPAPDTQIRVFMTYRPSDKSVDIPEQTLPHYERNGFTLVEWGGSEK